MHRGLIVLMVLAGCGSSGEEGSRNGTWLMIGMECNGQPVLVTGLTETLTVTDTEVTIVDRVAGCTVTQEGPTLEAQATTVRCDPDPCTLTVLGQTIRCPADYPMTAGVPTVEISGDRLRVTAGNCTTEYQR